VDLVAILEASRLDFLDAIRDIALERASTRPAPECFLKSADSVMSIIGPFSILRVHGDIARVTVEEAVGHVEICSWPRLAFNRPVVLNL
jgi:hypothetical protein